MIPNPGFIDLDHLTHRLLITHRLLLQFMKKPSSESAKDLYVISDGNVGWIVGRASGLPLPVQY